MNDGETATFRPVGAPRVVEPRYWAPHGPPSPMLPPDARRLRGGRVWDVMLGLDAAIVGSSILFGLLFYFLYLSDPGIAEETSRATESLQGSLVWLNLTNLLMFAVVPIAWVLGTRVEPIRGGILYLKLDRPFPAVFHALGYTALLIGLVILLTLFFEIVGYTPEAPAAIRFDGIGWGMAIMTAAVAGFGEEIFFRGVLQRFIGVWGQALVFGLAHVANGWLGFVVTASIGLLFGMLVKRGRSLWLVITIHFLYDVVLLGYEVVTGGAGVALVGP